MKYMGRNYNYSERLGKWLIFTEVDGHTIWEQCDTKALVQARFQRLRDNGYQYIDPHKDKSL